MTRLCYNKTVPRFVDEELRRRAIAEAVWRVIRRDGLAAASVRTVAEEAGLSGGSLRHYFGTQAELLSFSLRLIGERIRDRLTSVDPDRNPRRVLEEVVDALVPLDDERRAEAEVWFVFTAAALADPALRELSAEAYDGTRVLLRTAVEHLAASRTARAGLDVEVETARLHALLDGLALHAVTKPVDTEEINAVLARHLDGLCRRR